MTAVLNYVILALIGLCILAAFFFVFRAIGSRSKTTREAYGVGQQEARQSMQIDIARGVAFVFVGLILWGVYGLSSRPEEAIPKPSPTSEPAATTPPTSPPLAATTPAAEPTATSAPTMTSTSSAPTPTDTPTVEPSSTPSPAPQTAVVISEVGVWLRRIPGINGAQLEWVLNGTELTLLPGLEAADDFQWQQVRTPAGNEGWVAVDFISYTEPQ